MPHLLHIDSSIQGDRSVSRALTARAAAVWRATHPGGTVTYRDLAAPPPPHFDAATGLARMIPVDQHTPEQAASLALSLELVDEVKQADTVLLGLPVYNFGAPSSVKSWVDHLIVPGAAFHHETREPFLAGTELIVLASRGGGYGEGTPREGWDHAQAWLPHGLKLTGLAPRFIRAHARQRRPKHGAAQGPGRRKPGRCRTRDRRTMGSRARSGVTNTARRPGPNSPMQTRVLSGRAEREGTMADYGHELQFGSFITPQSERPQDVVALAQVSERAGLDLVTFQDHPYQPAFLDTWTLLSWVAATVASSAPAHQRTPTCSGPSAAPAPTSGS